MVSVMIKPTERWQSSFVLIKVSDYLQEYPYVKHIATRYASPQLGVGNPLRFFWAFLQYQPAGWWRGNPTPKCAPNNTLLIWKCMSDRSLSSRCISQT